MKWFWRLALVAGLGVAAYPIYNKQENPPLDMVDVSEKAWDHRREAWQGNPSRRDDIIVSAVWSADGRYYGPRP